MPESDLEREERAYKTRERTHGAKRLLMGAFLAALVAGGAYVLFTSSTPKEQVAQQDVTPSLPTFTPPTMPPPIPLPDAVPMPKAEAPAAGPDHGQPVTLPTPPAAPQ